MTVEKILFNTEEERTKIWGTTEEDPAYIMINAIAELPACYFLGVALIAQVAPALHVN